MKRTPGYILSGQVPNQYLATEDELYDRWRDDNPPEPQEPRKLTPQEIEDRLSWAALVFATFPDLETRLAQIRSEGA